MNYKALRSGIEYFKVKFNDGETTNSYAALRSKGDPFWRHLDRLDSTVPQDISKQLSCLEKDVIYGFLNTGEWNCHIPANNTEKLFSVLVGLQAALQGAEPYYSEIERFHLEQAEFEGIHCLGDGEFTLSQLVDRIYHEFLDIKPKFGKVPASKLMHMALPNLFVMWDNGIINRYGLPFGKGGAEPSYSAFLMLMQENLRHALSSISEPGLEAHLQSQWLRRRFDGLPLPRLLDMANMAIRDCELAVCVSCMRRAKRRWAAHGIIREYREPSYMDSADDSVMSS